MENIWWFIGKMSRKYGDSHGLYHLIMTNSSPWYRRPIKIDGLPFLKMVDLSMGKMGRSWGISWKFSLQWSNSLLFYRRYGISPLMGWNRMGYYGLLYSNIICIDSYKLPSGNLTVCELEHGPFSSWICLWKVTMFQFAMLVYQRVVLVISSALMRFKQQ